MSNTHASPPKLFSRAAEIIFFGVWTAITVLLSYWLGQQSYSWMPPQATLEAQKVDGLFSFLVTLGSAIFLGVFGMIGHSIVVCRADKGDFSEGHPVRSNTKLEILWTGIPVLLVLWISIQGIHVYSLLDLQGLSTFAHNHSHSPLAQAEALQNRSVQSQSVQSQSVQNQPAQNQLAQMVSSSAQLAQAATSEVVEVTAKQWGWSFRYPQQNITSSELHLLVNQRSRLVLKSADVLHGFYVPAFRIKQDIIPNRDINFVFSPTLEGKYRLQDSQFSGAFFPLMEADVYVESPADYQRWLSQAAQNSEVMLARSLVDLSAAERANPPNLWGQRWAVEPALSATVTAIQKSKSKIDLNASASTASTTSENL